MARLIRLAAVAAGAAALLSAQIAAATGGREPVPWAASPVTFELATFELAQVSSDPASRAARKDRTAQRHAVEAQTKLDAAVARAEAAARETEKLLAEIRRALGAANAAANAARAAAARARNTAERLSDDGRTAGQPSVLPSVLPAPGGGRVLRVGPNRKLRMPSAAAAMVQDGDMVEIEAGLYAGDVAIWRARNLTIRGVGGQAHLRADGRAAENKGIWVVKGDNTVIENIVFSGAQVRDGNGAGIRQEGANLTVRRSGFFDNQNGILSGKSPDSAILIEFSEFARNGRGKGQTHNIYVGAVASLTVRYSYIHHARVGHNVKSRARKNRILYNKVMDAADGNASYQIDLPDGGDAVILGNVIQQGPHAENWAIINFGSARRGAADRMYVASNTIVNDRSSGVFIQNRSSGPVTAINNIFAGPGKTLQGPGTLRGNLITSIVNPGAGGLLKRLRERLRGSKDEGALKGNLTARHPGFADPTKYDYGLAPGSSAIDAGIDPGLNKQAPAQPKFQYRHPTGAVPRIESGPLDIGAFEAPR